MARDLTARQLEFCRQWFETKGIARQAYLASGYRCKSAEVADAAASRLLGNVKVRGKILELGAMAAKRHEITQDNDRGG